VSNLPPQLACLALPCPALAWLAMTCFGLWLSVSLPLLPLAVVPAWPAFLTGCISGGGARYHFVSTSTAANVDNSKGGLCQTGSARLAVRVTRGDYCNHVSCCGTEKAGCFKDGTELKCRRFPDTSKVRPTWVK